MLASKRVQIRREVRQGQIQQQFTLRRKQLAQGRSGLAHQLHAAVQAECFQGTNMEMVGRLLAYQQVHPYEENTYIIISNYLFDHNESLYCFYTRLLDTPRRLENHMYCLAVVVYILSQDAARLQKQEQFRIRQRMEEILENACEVMRHLIADLKQGGPLRQAEREKYLQIWPYFTEIVKIAVSEQLYEFVPVQAVELFGAGVGLMAPEELSGQLMAAWKCLQAILKLQEEITSVQDLLANSWQVFWLVLKELPHQRPDLLAVMEDLLLKYPMQFISAFLRREVVMELLYILDEVPACKPKTVRVLKMVISQCAIKELVLLLQLKTHQLLTQTLSWSMTAANNECLIDCLIALYHILLLLLHQQETKLLARVKREIQELDFDRMLQGLSSQLQNPDIAHQINLIIDDFYSSEVQ